jgi:hypothetical protein
VTAPSKAERAAHRRYLERGGNSLGAVSVLRLLDALDALEVANDRLTQGIMQRSLERDAAEAELRAALNVRTAAFRGEDNRMSALDILSRDRDEWKAKAGAAEAELRKLRGRTSDLMAEEVSVPVAAKEYVPGMPLEVGDVVTGDLLPGGLPHVVTSTTPNAAWDENLGTPEGRIERLERVLRGARAHEPGCPAGHDCDRDHPEFDVYHPPQPCTCWLSDTRETK